MFETLSPSHIKGIAEYVKFEKKMRESTMSQVLDIISDVIMGRLTDENAYSTDELQEMFNDIPDLVESTINDELEHQRDLLLILLTTFFSQTQGASINVSRLEDESSVNDAEALSTRLLEDEDSVLEEAVSKNGGLTEMEQLIRENLALKKAIKDKLENNPQYKQLVKFNKRRDEEISKLSV